MLSPRIEPEQDVLFNKILSEISDREGLSVFHCISENLALYTKSSYTFIGNYQSDGCLHSISYYKELHQIEDIVIPGESAFFNHIEKNNSFIIHHNRGENFPNDPLLFSKDFTSLAAIKIQIPHSQMPGILMAFYSFDIATESEFFFKLFTSLSLLLSREFSSYNNESILKNRISKFKEQFETFPYPIHLYRYSQEKFKLTHWNTAALTLPFQYDTQQDLFSENIWSENSTIIDEIIKCYNTKFTTSLECNLPNSNRSTRKYYTLSFSYLAPNYVQIIFVDISKRYKLINELSNQKKLFESVFNSITDGIAILDNHSKIVMVNKGIERIFEYNPEEMDGLIMTDYLADEINTASTFPEVVALAEQTEDNFTIKKFKKKSGAIFPGEVFMTRLLNNENHQVGFLVIIRDVTERAQIIEELVLAKKKAEESDKLKTAFLANMSHEIRTPMNGIIGFSEMLIRPNISQERREYFAKVVIDSGHQLLKVVKDIMELSKLETGQVELKKESISLDDIINEVYTLYQNKSKETKILIIKDINPDYQFTKIITDKEKVISILDHLLSNAFKFTTEGYIKIGYTLKDSHIEFFVEDTGIGIDELMHHKIFEQFRQIETAMARQYSGTGLGLTIAKKILTLLNGRIWLQSEPNKGSTFFFNIPIEYEKTSSSKAKEQKYTLLIAEDEEINYLYLERILEPLNCEILRANNGEEAIYLYQQNPGICLILMDIRMPNIDGFEATKKILQLNPKVPIIAQTAFSSINDKQKALQAGCCEYVSKPIDRNHFLKLVKFHIDKYCNSRKQS